MLFEDLVGACGAARGRPGGVGPLEVQEGRLGARDGGRIQFILPGAAAEPPLLAPQLREELLAGRRKLDAMGGREVPRPGNELRDRELPMLRGRTEPLVQLGSMPRLHELPPAVAVPGVALLHAAQRPAGDVGGLGVETP